MEETAVASGVALTAVPVAAGALVAVTVGLVALPMASAALPMLRVDLALPLADTAADLTVIATITEAVEDMDDATTTEAVAATAVAASTDQARAATWSRLVPDRATAATAVLVGIAIEVTMTAEEGTTIAEETTLASDRTKVARATRESESCVDTNGDRTVGLVVGILSPLVSLFSRPYHLSPFDIKGKQTEARAFSQHLEALFDQGKFTPVPGPHLSAHLEIHIQKSIPRCYEYWSCCGLPFLDT